MLQAVPLFFLLLFFLLLFFLCFYQSIVLLYVTGLEPYAPIFLIGERYVAPLVLRTKKDALSVYNTFHYPMV
jgi:hypothetical protein